MKIICVGRNYSEHAKEMGAAVPENPVVFMKPQTALLKDNKPFYHPEWSQNIHYETELVLKICKQGKYVDEKFASKYFDEITTGIDFTARDLQEVQKEKRLPWEISKSFDNSAVIGKFFKLSELKNSKDIHFSMDLNGQKAQQGSSAEMLFSFEKIIAYVSRFFTLQVGDLIYTGTPVGVAAIKPGDRLEGFLEKEKVFDFEVK